MLLRSLPPFGSTAAAQHRHVMPTSCAPNSRKIAIWRAWHLLTPGRHASFSHISLTRAIVAELWCRGSMAQDAVLPKGRSSTSVSPNSRPVRFDTGDGQKKRPEPRMTSITRGSDTCSNTGIREPNSEVKMNMVMDMVSPPALSDALAP